MSLPLTPRLLEFAYRQGFFPMSDPESDEIHWYRPDPRAILPLDGFHCSRSFYRTLKRGLFSVTYNRCFQNVMRHCADRSEGSWISEEFIDAYGKLHEQGKAHSVEVWSDTSLVGGVYGVSFGGAFFAESMFHKKTDASKVALYYLVQELSRCGYKLLEVQFLTPHLQRLGAVEVSDQAYERLLRNALSVRPQNFGF